jgi:hypothetical protein
VGNEHTSLVAELISTYHEASHLLSDYHYAVDDGGESWWSQWRSREYGAAAELVETLFDGEAFVSKRAKTMVCESLDWYRTFMNDHGYSFTCLKLDRLTERVAKADIAGQRDRSFVNRLPSMDDEEQLITLFAEVASSRLQGNAGPGHDVARQ